VTFEPTEVVPGVLLRPATLKDAAGLSDAYIRNREHVRRWDPRRPDGFWTENGQRQRLRGMLDAQEDGRALATVLVVDGRIAGVVNLTGIAMGPFLSAGMGYWVDAEQGGRGIATAAVQAVCRIADEVLGLHRIQADTLLENVPSQRVLAKCGFERIGMAPSYLHIDGEWKDLYLHQLILNDRPAA
jgi:[ribosomal protein S5]-alanine N-acetyltransferase